MIQKIYKGLKVKTWDNKHSSRSNDEWNEGEQGLWFHGSKTENGITTNRKCGLSRSVCSRVPRFLATAWFARRWAKIDRQPCIIDIGESKGRPVCITVFHPLWNVTLGSRTLWYEIEIYTRYIDLAQFDQYWRYFFFFFFFFFS